ncbi:MAG: tagatose 1,6-diphosphate aldolase [Inquilinus sp.]|nr:tagatose 1,6-diphosphate aldolase [Inquilinus sp.]
MAMSAGKLWGFRRLADDTGRFKMTAVDQRPPIINLIKEKRGVAEADFAEICDFKAALVGALAPMSSAVLLDPYYAYPAAVGHVRPSQGLLLTLEDSQFEEVAGGRRTHAIADWSVEKIRRLGADGVKLLAWYRPDAAPEIVEHQQRFVESVGQACRAHDICFLLELLVYPLPGESGQTQDYIEHAAKRPQLVIDSMKDFADPKYGVDIYKLESPVAADNLVKPGAEGSDEIQAWFDALGKACPRPWVMLSAGAGQDVFRHILTYAYRAGASGFLAGRAIWWQAGQHFPDMDRMNRALMENAVPYMRELNALTYAAATPWHDHPCFPDGVELADAGPGFNSTYGGIG